MRCLGGNIDRLGTGCTVKDGTWLVWQEEWWCLLIVLKTQEEALRWLQWEEIGEEREFVFVHVAFYLGIGNGCSLRG